MERMLNTPEGLQLWSQTFGDPAHPALLLVMGAMAQGIFWPESFCQQLAQAGLYVVRYDHRDTGRSSCVNFLRHPYNLQALTRDALAVLDGLGVTQATVVGLSMGGFIAQLMAAHHPQRVRRLALLSTSADHRPYVAATLGLPTGLLALPPPEPVFLDYLKALRRHPPRTTEALLDSLHRGWEVTYAGPRPYPRDAMEPLLHQAMRRSEHPRAALHHALAVSGSGNRLKLVGSIRTPTLVIHGRHDPCLPLAHGEYLAHHIPGAQLQVLEMGHSFMGSWDAEVLQALLTFAAPVPSK